MVATERASRLTESIERLVEEQEQVELDYRAWKLLADALKEAEGEENAHLGRAITPRIRERFGELTGDRYGELSLGPNLEARGVIAEGGERDVDKLSIGTQEQLSTLFRLIVAEQLRTAVILDDQLTQTDGVRMRAFRRWLRESAARIQILVVTCHPDDYLAPAELPGDDQPVAEDGLLRAIDLARTVRRA